MLAKNLRRSLLSIRAFSTGPEWGLKFDDECLKFEEQWQTIASKIETE